MKALLEALQPDQPETVRISVITAFGVQGDDRACGPIIAALADPSENVRLAAQARSSRSTPRHPCGCSNRPPATSSARWSSASRRSTSSATSAPPRRSRRSSSCSRTPTKPSAPLRAPRSKPSPCAASTPPANGSNGGARIPTSRARRCSSSSSTLQTERIESLSRVLEKLYLKILDDPKNQNDSAAFIEALTQCDLASGQEARDQGTHAAARSGGPDGPHQCAGRDGRLRAAGRRRRARRAGGRRRRPRRSSRR